MGELKPDEQVGIVTPFAAVGRSADIKKLFEPTGMGFVNHQLTGVGTSIGCDGSGFSPDQFGSASSKSFISANGQDVRRTTGRAVAAFHGMNGETVSNTFHAYGERLAEDFPVFRQTNIKSALTHFLNEIIRGLVFEESGQSVLFY
jgi:hypothetical protein